MLFAIVYRGKTEVGDVCCEDISGVPSNGIMLRSLPLPRQLYFNKKCFLLLTEGSSPLSQHHPISDTSWRVSCRLKQWGKILYSIAMEVWLLLETRHCPLLPWLLALKDNFALWVNRELLCCCFLSQPEILTPLLSIRCLASFYF